MTGAAVHRVRVSTGDFRGAYGPVAADAPDLTGGWRPLRVLGAASGGGLALPQADPTPEHLYAPRGVLLDPAPGGGVRVVAADTGNHRLMVWRSVPGSDGAACDAVLGQPDPRSEGPQAGGRGPERGLHLPTGLARVTGAGHDLVLVADGWNHRLIGYDAALADDAEPVFLMGQNTFGEVTENAGGEPDGASLYWPFGVTWHDGWLWVCDTGNRRVLGWRGLPASPRHSADVVLGQPSPHGREENRGGPPGPASFRWPHAVAICDGVFWVADTGNHRLLGWRLPVTGDRPADLVLGQSGFTTAEEVPHRPQGPHRLRFPYSVAAADGSLLVADTANNRVLGWSGPIAGVGAPADHVLGQDDLDRSGENRWTAVTADGLCWPYGLSAITPPEQIGAAPLLAVADSGNNRVVLWHRS